MKKWASTNKGFTIVELLIVIVVIAILAAISIVAYTGIQARAKQTRIAAELDGVRKKIEMYRAETGFYPRTVDANTVVSDWGALKGYADENCKVGTANRKDWVPGIDGLPQSKPDDKGAGGYPGCYEYASNGDVYILSAWNMLASPITGQNYRRVGFREMDQNVDWRNPHYVCNLNEIGGGATYSAANDLYKYSYTFSNINNTTSSLRCDETNRY